MQCNTMDKSGYFNAPFVTHSTQNMARVRRMSSIDDYNNSRRIVKKMIPTRFEHRDHAGQTPYDGHGSINRRRKPGILVFGPRFLVRLFSFVFNIKVDNPLVNMGTEACVLRRPQARSIEDNVNRLIGKGRKILLLHPTAAIYRAGSINY